MSQTEEIYEKIRVLLSPRGALLLPKHEATEKMLQVIFTEEEAQLVSSSITRANKNVSVEKICEMSNLPQEKVQKLLDQMVYKGTLMKREDSNYYIKPFLPGLFEYYFTFNRDTPERMIEAAKYHRILREAVYRPDKKFPRDPPTEFNKMSLWRFAPAFDPISKTIEINKTIEKGPEILPYEALGPHLAKYKTFSVTPCACRVAADFSGNPCSHTDRHDNQFCAQMGDFAKSLIAEGIATELTYEEMIERLKEAETHGLVHSASNTEDPSAFVCNCCPDCCEALNRAIMGSRRGFTQSNFNPIVNEDDCTLCDTCVDICPMSTITHQEDPEKIIMDYNNCLGCGLCAANCPEEAITLEKVRDNKPIPSIKSFRV
jgi:Pyruvate/2-oxoacid:ferredoxin oxidoreductase delta subunit